jgi:hypothetical protein
MIAAGVQKFVYGPGRFVGDGEQWEASATMFAEAGVKFGEMIESYTAQTIRSTDPDREWFDKVFRLFRTLSPERPLTETDHNEILESLELKADPAKTVLRILKARP